MGTLTCPAPPPATAGHGAELRPGRRHLYLPSPKPMSPSLTPPQTLLPPHWPTGLFVPVPTPWIHPHSPQVSDPALPRTLPPSPLPPLSIPRPLPPQPVRRFQSERVSSSSSSSSPSSPSWARSSSCCSVTVRDLWKRGLMSCSLSGMASSSSTSPCAVPHHQWEDTRSSPPPPCQPQHTMGWRNRGTEPRDQAPEPVYSLLAKGAISLAPCHCTSPHPFWALLGIGVLDQTV